jgi:hypothetical protein
MKKILLSAVILFSVYCADAQTNTFPTTGNAGIGTTSPLSLLHVTGNIGGGEILRLNNTDATDGRTTIFFSSSNGPQSWEFGENIGGGPGLFGLRDMTTSGNPIRFVVNTSGNMGIGTITPGALLNVSGLGSNANGLMYVQSSDVSARGTLMRTGSYEYTSQDNSGSYFQAWGMRLNGADNLWYRMYTTSAKYLPYTAITGGGTIVFGGSASSATTDANPTLNPVMTVNVGTPSVSIGTTNPQGYMLAVNGSAIATSMTVKLNANWPDYVFKPDYQLPTLQEVKTYIDQNHHLPEMPSEQDVKKDGLNLGEMNKLLTKKVEELTLYAIEKDKQVKEDETKLNNQEVRISKLEKELEMLLKMKATTKN